MPTRINAILIFLLLERFLDIKARKSQVGNDGQCHLWQIVGLAVITYEATTVRCSVEY